MFFRKQEEPVVKKDFETCFKCKHLLAPGTLKPFDIETVDRTYSYMKSGYDFRKPFQRTGTENFRQRQWLCLTCHPGYAFVRITTTLYDTFWEIGTLVPEHMEWGTPTRGKFTLK